MPGPSSGDPPPPTPDPWAPLSGDTNPPAAALPIRRSGPPPQSEAPEAEPWDWDPAISRLVRLQLGHQDALIEVLHAVQQLHGHLPKPALRQVAQELHLPLSRVYGVASFYHLFHLQPATAHRCSVCLGTACFVRGGEALVDRLRQIMELPLDRPANKGRWGLESLSCIGACGQAPVLLIDDQVVANLPLNDPEALELRLRQALADAEDAVIPPASANA